MEKRCFKKAYGLVFQILKEHGLNLKTLAVITKTQTRTRSKNKFMVEVSESFEIKMANPEKQTKCRYQVRKGELVSVLTVRHLLMTLQFWHVTL